MSLKNEIEGYIADWHWDEPSKAYAFELGKFLFSFLDYLDELELSDKTKRNHRSNVYLVGMFEATYGYNDEFYPEDLENGPSYLYEFERKVSDSKYAVQSYESTWRKLDKYIKSGAYKPYLNKMEEKLSKENGPNNK